MEEKYSFRTGQHRLVIDNRERSEVFGVVHVDSFDEEEVIMETELGILAVRGENLHIRHLNLEQGEVVIEGLVLELAYAEDKGQGRGKGVWQRIFK
ncbi:MAG: sporulation protein YabP [Firmicutes bacterium]|nr:sporulation protein YabP [Bacillota bacterium]